MFVIITAISFSSAERFVSVHSSDKTPIVEAATQIDSLAFSQDNKILKLYRKNGTIQTRNLGDIDSISVKTVKENQGYTVTKEMEFGTKSHQKGSYMSPVITYKGSIYLVYIDGSNRMMVAKKSPDGSISQSVAFSTTINDIYHTAGSIGIDKNGYIHVVGNMHNHSWQYVVSDSPEDISSFTFYGDDPNRAPPAGRVSYASFARDRNGELYLAFRFRFEEDWSVYPGVYGGAVARYSSSAKEWTMLGGNEGTPHGAKTLFWTDVRGGIDHYYQSFKMRLCFDRTNRMHVATVFANDPNDKYSSNHGTHVVYAYSDDRGDTFSRANGDKITSYPITLDNGDIAVEPPWPSNGLVDPNVTMAVLPNGIPMFVVMPQKASVWDSHIVQWTDNSGWQTPVQFNSARSWSMVADDFGIVTLSTGDKSFARSYDLGNTWHKEFISEKFYDPLFDYQFMRDNPGDLRYYSYDGMVRVITIRFD